MSDLLQQKTLYDTINSIYKNKESTSRVLYVAKLLHHEEKKDAKNKKDITSIYIQELESILQTIDRKWNMMIIFVGTLYAFVGLENGSNDNIMKLLAHLKNKTPMTETINIISVVEESPVSTLPIWYKYEGEVMEKESHIYKDKTTIEKGWVLYENYLCNFGRILKGLIKTKDDIARNEQAINAEEKKYVKYLPSINEINEFTGSDYVSIETFNQMYFENLELEFDDDVVYPYYWPVSL